MTDLAKGPAVQLEDPALPIPAAADALLLVDFDHTLLAANSTELFIGACRPSALVGVIDFGIRQCIPWRLLKTKSWFRLRDYVCVIAILILTPWNLWLWRRQAPALFKQKASPAVLDMLDGADPSRIAVVSFGLQFVIRALLAGGRFATVNLVATSLRPSRAWIAGKSDIALAAFGREAVAKATFVTDSEDDRDLIDLAGRGIMIEPQGAKNLARYSLYLPFRYSGAVKYTPGFVIDQWIFVDAAVCGLAMAHGLVGLLQMAVIAPLILASYMCIYEIGYFENDMVAALKEGKPGLNGREVPFQNYPIKINGWIGALLIAAVAFGFAVVFGLLGVEGALWGGAAWVGLLIVSRLLFQVYNRLSTGARLYLYPALQLSKYCSILLIFPPTFAGALMVFAHIVNMWVSYIIYRLGGQNLKLPKEVFRIMLFMIGGAILGLSGALNEIIGPAAPATVRTDELVALSAILAWSAFRIGRRALSLRVKGG